jgi:phosphatidylglycerophosphate synthase
MSTATAHKGRELRRSLADGLTASRLLVALALLGEPAPAATVFLVTWAWASDAVDGPLARTSGRPGRLARIDHAADAAVGVALIWHLGAVGLWPQLPVAAGAALLLAAWAITRAFAVQMLLLAVAYAGFLWWVGTVRPWAWALPPVVAAAVLATEWRRFVRELVPGFLRGWRDLLAGRN